MAEDATYLDTTGMPLEEVVDKVMGLVEAARGNSKFTIHNAK
jgi:cytidylate kinase